METSINIPIWVLAIVVMIKLYIVYVIYEKGRKNGRKEVAWLQKIGISLIQKISGGTEPHLIAIPITDDNGINKGNKKEFPECPEGFNFCVFLNNVLAEPSPGEEALLANLTIQEQREYLLKLCYDFGKLEKVRIETRLFTRREGAILKNIIFLKIDTIN